MSSISLSTHPVSRAGRPPLATVSVGATTVHILSDGHLDIPAAFFSGAPEDTPDPVRFAANLWWVDTGDRVVLIDAGSGDSMKARFPDTGDLLMQYDLHHLGPSRITDIVITHMHADHIGGLVHEGVPAYPKANIHIARTEWEYWTDPDLVAQTPEDRRPAVMLTQSIAEKIRDQVQTHDGPSDLGDGINLVPAPGHTPGHCAVRVTSEGASMLLLGDAVVSGVLQFANPDITYALDSDPAQAVATRRALLSDLADTGDACAITHLAYPGAGYVARDGDGFRFTPVT